MPIDEVGDRVAATMALVYPPGIGVVVPGERYDKRAGPMIAYLRLFEESYARSRVRLFTYVIREEADLATG